MALQATLGPPVYLQTDFRRITRVYDPAVLAEYPDPVDPLLAPHVLKNAVYVGRLILKHGKAGALCNRLGELVDVPDRFLQEFFALVAHDQHGKQQHCDSKCNRDVEANLKLERGWKHAVRTDDSATESENAYLAP